MCLCWVLNLFWISWAGILKCLTTLLGTGVADISKVTFSASFIKLPWPNLALLMEELGVEIWGYLQSVTIPCRVRFAASSLVIYLNFPSKSRPRDAIEFNSIWIHLELNSQSDEEISSYRFLISIKMITPLPFFLIKVIVAVLCSNRSEFFSKFKPLNFWLWFAFNFSYSIFTKNRSRNSLKCFSQWHQKRSYYLRLYIILYPELQAESCAYQLSEVLDLTRSGIKLWIYHVGGRISCQ